MIKRDKVYECGVFSHCCCWFAAADMAANAAPHAGVGGRRVGLQGKLNRQIII